MYSRADGFKYFENFDTGRWPQNWSITRDKLGIIYVGNQNYLYIFDGGSPRKITIPNNTVRSVAVHHNGTVYIGGINEIGYLSTTAGGSFKYQTLTDRLEEKYRNFSMVWRVNSAEDGIYFRTWKYLFRYSPRTGEMKTWTSRGRFNASFSCNGKLLVHQRGIGLMEVNSGRLEPLPGTESIVAKKIFMIVPYDRAGRKLLIGTGNSDFFIYDYDKTEIAPFATRANDYIKANKLSHGIRLAPGTSNAEVRFAAATLRGGLVIFDSRGRLIRIFTTSDGLKSNSVKFVHEDNRGSLWLALGEGICRVDYNNGISIFDKRSGLHGIVMSVTRHQDHLYAGTTQGLFRLRRRQDPLDIRQFDAVPGMTLNCCDLLPAGDHILVATNKDIAQVDWNVGKPSIHKVLADPSRVLASSILGNRWVWAGTRRGLVLLAFNDQGRWQTAYLVPGSPQGLQIQSIVEETVSTNGNRRVWLGTASAGVYRIDFSGLTLPFSAENIKTRIDTFGEAEGLYPGEVLAAKAAGHMMFGTDTGLTRFDEKTGHFIPDPVFGPRFIDKTRNIFRIVEDKRGHIWFHSEFFNYRAVPRSDGTFQVIDKPFRRIPPIQVNQIYLEPRDDVAWLAANNGLIRWETAKEQQCSYDFPTIIRAVSVNGEIILNGNHTGSQSGVDKQNYSHVFQYSHRNFRFTFAAPCFQDTRFNRYRFFLEGYEDTWSRWNPETRKDYTNLDDGKYRFRVQARDIYHNTGREAVFSFRVLPPWYDTWWAYCIYAGFIILSVFLIVKWRLSNLEREKRRLEQVVDDRTKEIKEKNLQLEEQSEKLKEIDRIKTRFFTNISHEFRTPLTLIMGPLEQLRTRFKNERLTSDVNMALRNSRRLLTLINQLLELSKLDGGKLQLRVVHKDIVYFLKVIAGNFESLAAAKGLQLDLQLGEEEISLYFDPEKLERVMINLMANAVKFTPPPGKIVVKTAVNSDGFIEISVADTGIGISDDQIPHIFDRFYQAGETVIHEHKRKGTGIGLALVKELVELHHGTIAVHSREGRGTEFTVRLPLDTRIFRPDEIADHDLEPPAPGHISYEDDLLPEPEPESAAETGESEKDVILVVEDNPDMRSFICRTLREHYTVMEAPDGKQGIEIAKRVIPDLVVSDVMMPEVDGFQLCESLKTDVKTSHVPVILLTAKASEHSVVRGLETGADDYVTKPFSSKILLTRIKNLVELRRGLQEKIQKDLILQPAEIRVSSIDQEFMKEMKTAIENEMSEPEFGVDGLAKAMLMGRTTLNRKVRAITGESTNRFIQSYRLKRAAQLLKANAGNVTDVAFQVGFSNSSYFTRCFREKFHCSPSAFQATEAGERQ